QIAIITGASSGIGLATVQAFLSSNWLVFGVDISPSPPSITSSPNKFHFLQTNLTQPSAPNLIVSTCQSTFNNPRIDALINVAGILDKNAGVDNLQDDDWDRVIAVNLTAPVRLMRAVVNVMKQQDSGGCIVNVSSKAGMSGAVAGVAYTASKHGLIGATKNTAWLYKEEGIRCNAICPGAVATNIGSNIDRTKWDMYATEKFKSVQNTHWDPTSSPDKIQDASQPADVILFLVSDAARGVNGAIVPVDNAWSVI
ncbi:NAD(P)-binding protein, partial [Dendrothele bispora CBS 962.96]